MFNDKLQQIREDLERSRSYLQQVQTTLPKTTIYNQNLDNIHLFNKRNKLHVGCGQVRLEGWINIDESFTEGITDIQLDVTTGLPFEDKSCQIIYHEHFLEHLSAETGLKFVKECHRVLTKGGVMRIAMPSLDVIIEKCYLGQWRDQGWLKWPEYQFIKTRAEMLNIAFRWWGHQWLYDREELHRRLRDAGFSIIRDVEWGNSDIPDLRNLETRKDSLLICEVSK